MPKHKPRSEPQAKTNLSGQESVVASQDAKTRPRIQIAKQDIKPAVSKIEPGREKLTTDSVGEKKELSLN